MAPPRARGLAIRRGARGDARPALGVSLRCRGCLTHAGCRGLLPSPFPNPHPRDGGSRGIPMANVLTRRTKFLLGEDRIPRAWYNVVADLRNPPPPVLHP